MIGVSGGLDSTHALIVAAKTCDYLDLPRSTILGFTMPGFATGETTKGNAWALMSALGIEGAEIDIRPAASQMLKDMGHPFARGESVYDVTFENVQAGLRTDYLFRLANHRGGFVIGTGDLSRGGARLVHLRRRRPDEPLCGQCRRPQDADPISRPLGRSRSDQFDAETDRVLQAILDTKISPELVPADEKRNAVDRGQDRALRAARFLPLAHPAPRPAAVEGRLPRLAGVEATPRPACGRSTIRSARSANTTSPPSANGWKSSCSASSRSASTSAAAFPTRPRSRLAGR